MKKEDPTGKDASESSAEGARPEESQGEESMASGAAKTANSAMKDTAHKYLGAAGIKVDLEDVENKIRDRPLFYLAIAAGSGFVIGGGLATKIGLTLLGLAGRKAAAETATNFGRQVLRQAAGRGQA
jgi:hypothetical protein